MQKNHTLPQNAMIMLPCFVTSCYTYVDM